MDQTTATAFVAIALPLIRERLRAALEIEVLTFDANILLNAASLINRLAEQAAAGGERRPEHTEAATSPPENSC